MKKLISFFRPSTHAASHVKSPEMHESQHMIGSLGNPASSNAHGKPWITEVVQPSPKETQAYWHTVYPADEFIPLEQVCPEMLQVEEPVIAPPLPVEQSSNLVSNVLILTLLILVFAFACPQVVRCYVKLSGLREERVRTKDTQKTRVEELETERQADKARISELEAKHADTLEDASNRYAEDASRYYHDNLDAQTQIAGLQGDNHGLKEDLTISKEAFWDLKDKELPRRLYQMEADAKTEAESLVKDQISQSRKREKKAAKLAKDWEEDATQYQNDAGKAEARAEKVGAALVRQNHAHKAEIKRLQENHRNELSECDAKLHSQQKLHEGRLKASEDKAVKQKFELDCRALGMKITEDILKASIEPLAWMQHPTSAQAKFEEALSSIPVHFHEAQNGSLGAFLQLLCDTLSEWYNNMQQDPHEKQMFPLLPTFAAAGLYVTNIDKLLVTHKCSETPVVDSKSAGSKSGVTKSKKLAKKTQEANKIKAHKMLLKFSGYRSGLFSRSGKKPTIKFDVQSMVVSKKFVTASRERDAVRRELDVVKEQYKLQIEQAEAQEIPEGHAKDAEVLQSMRDELKDEIKNIEIVRGPQEPEDPRIVLEALTNLKEAHKKQKEKNERLMQSMRNSNKGIPKQGAGNTQPPPHAEDGSKETKQPQQYKPPVGDGPAAIRCTPKCRKNARDLLDCSDRVKKLQTQKGKLEGRTKAAEEARDTAEKARSEAEERLQQLEKGDGDGSGSTRSGNEKAEKPDSEAAGGSQGDQGPKAVIPEDKGTPEKDDVAKIGDAGAGKDMPKPENDQKGEEAAGSQPGKA